MREMGIKKGDALYYEIALDEERIQEDGIYSLEKIYTRMEEVFKRNDCMLVGIDGPMRTYTRNKDDKDLQCLWFAVGAFKETDWFEEYATHFMFYPFDEEEEDWLVECGIHLRKNLRIGAAEISSKMSKDYAKSVKRLLEDTLYQCTETDDFLLFHGKNFDEYASGVRLITVSMEESKKPLIAALIRLMRDDEFSDSVMVAFLKNTADKRKGVQSLVKLLKKTKRTYRAIVLDVTNTGWEEECDYTVENCYLTQRMYKNLVSVLHGSRNSWKMIPEDRKLLKGILFYDKFFSSNKPRGIECDYFQECGVKCFSFCLPVEGEILNRMETEVDTYRLGWYMDKLIEVAKEKI